MKSRRNVRRCVWMAVALAASTLLLTASPAQAAPGRAYVTNANSDTVSVIDTATDTVITTIAVGDRPEGVAVLPNGTRVYVVNSLDGTVSVINTATNIVVATVPVGGDPRSVTVTPDGTRAWVSGYSGTTVIDTATNTVVGTVAALPSSLDVAFSPNGSRAYGTGNDTLIVVDTATLARVAEVPTGHSPSEVLVSPDGSRVYVMDSVSGVRSYNTATNTEVARAQYPGPDITGMAISPDGTRLYLTQDIPAAVLVVDAATLAVVTTVPVGEVIAEGVGVSPSGDRLYVTALTLEGGSDRVVVIDTATNAVVANVGVGSLPMNVAVTSATPPPPPPPVIEGASFYTDGTSTRAGAIPGDRIALFTSSGVPGVTYRLVLSRDNCRTVLAVLNNTPRFANSAGVIGITAGYLPAATPAGNYQVCFMGSVGDISTITAPVSLEVTPFRG